MILTDVDGVLLDWFAGFRRYLRAKGIAVRDGDPSNWSMEGWTDRGDIQALIKEFNNSEHFQHLPHYVEARSQLRELHIEGHEIIAITSCSDDPKVHEMRKKNLEANFGKIFKEVICLPLMGDKTPILKKYPNAFWVEDSLHGAKAGVEAGHRSFLLDKPYNQADTKAERVSDWYEIYERVHNYSRA